VKLLKMVQNALTQRDYNPAVTIDGEWTVPNAITPHRRKSYRMTDGELWCCEQRRLYGKYWFNRTYADDGSSVANTAQIREVQA